jgi:hypothetical protein
VNGNASFTAGGNTIILTDPQNNFIGTLTLTDTTGDASITDANELTLGATNVAGDLTIITNADGTSTGLLTLNSGQTIGGNLDINTTGGITGVAGGGSTTIAGPVTVTGTVTSIRTRSRATGLRLCYG